jgi:hypothetical protein
MATLPPTRGGRRTTANGAQQSKPKSALSTSSLPSWCSGFRKESLDSDRAYNERVTTSTKTSEIRLRQESIRYWNRFLEEAEAAAFGKIVGPTCHQIKDILLGEFVGDGEERGEERGENQKQQEDHGIGNKSEGENNGMKNSAEIDGGNGRLNNGGACDGDDNWKYCQQLFGLPSASTTTTTPMITRQTDKIDAPSTSSTKSTPTPWNPNSFQVRYPLEVLPIFVITSPLISNCLQDRSKICHSMWRQLNGLEGTIGTRQSYSPRACGSNGGKHNVSNTSHDDDDRTICLYLPRLLSSWTETLHVVWDGLLSHYENTHDDPSMDPDDPRYYSNPSELASKRHSYHVSKRRHYEALLDRKVTTESQKSKIGTKKQQSLQDFILEFLRYVYEEPDEFSKQEQHERKRGDSLTPNMKTRDGNGYSKRNRPRRGNLILLLEDPRILHPKVATSAGHCASNSSSGSSGKPNNSNIVQSQLLETLAAWRGIHGIPVSLVIFHSVGSKHEIQQNNVLLNPSFESFANGGRFGIRAIRCSIPLSSSSSSSSIGSNIPPSMAFGVWSHYFLQATMDTPIPLLAPQGRHDQHPNIATESVLRMCRDGLQNESSCSKWVSSIRARLASNFYARKGSFVWDALNPKTAAMMRAPPLLSEATVVSGRDLATENTISSNNNSVGDKDRHLFAIGNDDVQIFQPEFVAWFCSYHKAHTLLSSQAGDQKADMTPSEKCEALLKCYRLLRPPIESKESKRHEEKPSKRRKLSNGDCHSRDSNSIGSLQFWWSVSCSLLPLYFLSLTVADKGMMVSTHSATAPGQTTANGSRKRRNDRPLDGEFKWVLERLADVYKQLLVVVEENDDRDRNNTPDSTPGIEDKIIIKSAELGTAATTAGDVKDSVPKESIGDSSDNNRESLHDEERDPDFVEATLRRYLQRGTEPGGRDTDRSRDSLAATGDATAIEKVHHRRIRQLTTMVREFIVLVATFSNGEKNSSSTVGNVDDDLAWDYKIRLGMTETILEMNRLALGQVEAWTKQWIEFNPLMAAPEEEVFREDCQENHTGDPSCDGVDDSSNTEGRPVNFRRRILDNLPAGSRQLYEALEGRLTVDRDDWFHSFGGTVEDFAIGVWTLRKCGLIRPKKTITVTATHKHERGKAKKRQEVVSYEKVAVVWC